MECGQNLSVKIIYSFTIDIYSANVSVHLVAGIYAQRFLFVNIVQSLFVYVSRHTSLFNNTLLSILTWRWCNRCQFRTLLSYSFTESNSIGCNGPILYTKLVIAILDNFVKCPAPQIGYISTRRTFTDKHEQNNH